jgi:hypothetical protein
MKWKTSSFSVAARLDPSDTKASALFLFYRNITQYIYNCERALCKKAKSIYNGDIPIKAIMRKSNFVRTSNSLPFQLHVMGVEEEGEGSKINP